MTRTLIAALAVAGVLISCHRAAEGAKNALNKGGEIAGAAATEVVEGVATGVEETWSFDVHLSRELSDRGIGLGKTSVESDTAGNANVLVVYLTNEKALEDTLRVVAMNKDSLEVGRAMLPLNVAAGMGAYYEVHFPARTDLERKSTIWIR